VTTEEYAFILDSFPLIPKEQRDSCLRAYSRDNSHRNTEAQKG
jgi:hypothetical protein